jgi:hypothetical protein
MDFIDQLIAYGKAKAEEADEKFKQYGIYGPNGPLGSLGQQQMKLEYDNESPAGYSERAPEEPNPIPIPNAQYEGKGTKRRMYVRNDDGTFDLMDVELDDNGNPVTLRRVHRGPEGPINA